MLRIGMSVMLAALFAAGVVAQMPRNAFLEKPATTRDALVRQVSTYPEVMDRYVRHFQMMPDDVVAFFSKLSLRKLDQDTEMEVFNVPHATGVLRAEKQVVKRGEAVWVDESGRIVMVAHCGNPVVRTDRAEEPDAKPQTSVQAEEKPMGAGAVTVDIVAPTPAPPAEPVAPDVEFVVPGAGGSSMVEEAAGFDFPGIAFLPTVLVGFRGSDNEPIPEPATVFGLSAGVAYLVARSRKLRH